MGSRTSAGFGRGEMQYRVRGKLMAGAAAAAIGLSALLVPATASAAPVGHQMGAAATVFSTTRLGVSPTREYNSSPTRVTFGVSRADRQVAQGTVVVRENGRSVGAGALNASGQGQAYLPQNLSIGAHSFYAVFVSADPVVAGSTSSTVSLTVLRSGSWISTNTAPRVSVGSGGSLSLKVAASGFVPTGRIDVYAAGKVVYRTALSGGAAAIKLYASMPVGVTELTVKYLGDTWTMPSSTLVRVTVTKRMSSITLLPSHYPRSATVNGALFRPTGTLTISRTYPGSDSVFLTGTLSDSRITFPQLPLVNGEQTGYRFAYSGVAHFASAVRYLAVNGTEHCCAG